MHHVFTLIKGAISQRAGKVTMNTIQKTVLAIFALVLTSHTMASSIEAAFDRKLEQAQNGDAEAQYDIGYRYEKGRGVDEDEDAALDWYRKSAGQGVGKAQYKVGVFYLKGSSVDKDLEVAKVWLEKAADQGYPPAQYQLGKLLASKRNADYSTALVWLQKAQDNGYEPATGEISRVKRKLN
jgi:TPR repeat protein